MSFLLAALLFLSSLALPLPAAADATVFIYHRFGEERYPTTNVSVERFREQMEYLAANNYQVIPLTALTDALAAGRSLPERTAVITIDDGYLSTYTRAWPILKEYGYPFTVFLYVRAVDRDYRNFLTWDQIREMAAAGVDFQNHSYSHPRLGDWPAGMDEEAYRQWIRDDISKGSAILTRETGLPQRHFAVPYGEYNSIVIDEVRKLGFESILLQDPGSVSADTDRFAIPREPILGRDWSTLDHFTSVLARHDLPITDRVPSIAPLVDSVPGRFGARLLHPDRYLPGTLGIYVSELGWRQARVDGDRVWIDNDTPLERRLNRVAVSGREKASGRTAIRFWMLLKPR